jgi:hypothetical protein
MPLVSIDMPADELSALAQFVKRVDYNTCVRFASVLATYNGRHEVDVMWSAVCLLQRQLADAGFAPQR